MPSIGCPEYMVPDGRKFPSCALHSHSVRHRWPLLIKNHRQDRMYKYAHPPYICGGARNLIVDACHTGRMRQSARAVKIIRCFHGFKAFLYHKVSIKPPKMQAKSRYTSLYGRLLSGGKRIPQEGGWKLGRQLVFLPQQTANYGILSIFAWD